MKFKPHNYQLQAINFGLAHKECALFLDCGLGKTIISLSITTILKARKALKGPTLVIAPKRPANSTWPNEINKWDHTKDLKYVICKGTIKKRTKILKNLNGIDIVIINTDLVHWLVEYYLEDWPFDMVIIDELSCFKDSGSSRTRALIKVRELITRVIGLTGTPASNGYMDLWAQYRILDKGKRLGETLGEYQQTYFKQGKTKGYVTLEWKISKASMRRIDQKISDMTLSQRACDFLDMPKLINVCHEAEMDVDMFGQYLDFAEEAVMELPADPEAEDPTEITAANAGVLTLKLTQFASGSIYDDNKETVYLHSAKYDVLEDLINAQNGKPCLVAYWFRSDREKLGIFLDSLKINGKKIRWGEIETKEDEDKWNRGEYDVALIHPARAAYGINIQEGGNALIWFTLPWSLELYQQTTDRIYRQGQLEDHVVIHHIITKNTIDERLYAVLGKKERTQNDLLNAVKKYVREIVA